MEGTPQRRPTFQSLWTPQTAASLGSKLRMSSEEVPIVIDSPEHEIRTEDTPNPETPRHVDTPAFLSPHIQDDISGEVHRARYLDPDLLNFLITMFEQIPTKDP